MPYTINAKLKPIITHSGAPTVDTETVIIELPPEALEWLERALQWPEDLERFDRLNTPTNLTEIVIGD